MKNGMKKKVAAILALTMCVSGMALVLAEEELDQEQANAVVEQTEVSEKEAEKAEKEHKESKPVEEAKEEKAEEASAPASEEKKDEVKEEPAEKADKEEKGEQSAPAINKEEKAQESEKEPEKNENEPESKPAAQPAVKIETPEQSEQPAEKESAPAVPSAPVVKAPETEEVAEEKAAPEIDTMLPTDPVKVTKAPFRADVSVKLENKGEIYYGDKVTLRAVVENANAEYTIRWEYYNDDADLEKGENPWVKCGTGEKYSFTVNEDNAKLTYRAVAVGK